ncbi:MAG: hypothetical protein K0U34_03085 [Alphaproteobacteria bacterium]|nr:hypothetical protein [Alphaproteobacteria bacterium]
MKILLNGVVMLAELAAVAAIAWLGWQYPFIFAGFTMMLALVFGLTLEHRRLRHELPFYFATGGPTRFRFAYVVGALEALLKSVLAAVAALFTFSGTDTERLMWVAIVFAATIYAGSATLRVLSLKFQAHPSRWGYFRLSVPLGLLFSAGLVVLANFGLFTAPSISDMGWKIIWELPPRPSVEQVSELFFGLKQAFDDFVVSLLSTVLSDTWARVVAVAVSVNVLTGFVAALYASAIASAVRGVEVRLF